MAGLNKITLIGNLGRDPEMRYTSSGTPVTNFSMAVSRVSRTPDGEQREETEWFTVNCWDRLAETANQYLQKGRQVYIEGRVSLGQWDDRQTGEKRCRLEVRATNLVLLGQRGDQVGAGEAATTGAGDEGAGDLDNMPF